MNYDHISRAVAHYKQRKYVYVQDAPWKVGNEAYYATKPPGTPDIMVIDESLGSEEAPHVQFAVASGEQSFIQMMLDGQQLKRAMCVTPCFRAETYNDWHRPYFMKVELINGQDVDEGHLLHMVHEACSFFEEFFDQVRVVKTADGYDIVEKDSRMELGSYGIRERWFQMPDKSQLQLRWIYGTGCAEPRLSTVIDRYQRGSHGLR